MFMPQQASDTVSYLPLLQTLLGGLLTFLGGLLGNFWIQNAQRKSERESLASAFYGEVSALLAMIEERQLVQLLTDLLKEVKETGKRTYTYFDSTSKKFEVYENNVTKIGLLPTPLPEKLVLFYSLALTVLNDMAYLGRLKSEKYSILVFEQYINSLVMVVNHTIKAGKEAQRLLQLNAGEVTFNNWKES
jgi:hypothetical protein